MKRKCILVADDDEELLKMLETGLQSEGFEIVSLKDGADVLNVMEKRKIDLVLLDIMMSGLSGFKVCEVIKKDKRFRNVPVIFITAKTTFRDMSYGKSLGCDDYITKPFSLKELIARIRRALNIEEPKSYGL